MGPPTESQQGPPPGDAQDGPTLERNLRALERTSPDAVAAIRSAAPHAGVEWIDTPEGPSATITSGTSGPHGTHGTQRALASKRGPRTEAARLAERVDIAASPGLVVLGFGLGLHVEAIGDRLKKTGVMLVFEPDVALLRAVFERIDCSAWLAETNVALLIDAEDAGAVHRAIRGVKGVVASGVAMVEHPPSVPRLGKTAAQFGETISLVLKGLKTTVVTTLMQAEVTMRNGLQNLDRYATTPGVAELADAAKGHPAICVAAGPSLARNIDQLRAPGVRDRCVIIAAQTVLKPMLAKGIKPHYVTALDYHEISRRFYEGLTADDVEGITLIAEPKANPAILEAYPGAIRTPRDDWLDTLLGELAVPKGTLTAGATVAHLSYYLARHLGCDPVALIGQDLAFTDGQYYAAGAAIHRVWAGELGAFNTLEMLEWQRIARMGSHLVKATDHLGRPVYTDEQMASYALQFSEAFAGDEARGLTTIDATEGGLAKSHTVVRPLAEVLSELPDTPLDLPATQTPQDTKRLRRVADRVRTVRGDALQVAAISRDTERLLGAMAEHHTDQRRVNELIGKAQTNGQRVRDLGAAYELTQHLNQTGALKRFRADRAIHMDAGASELDRQRAQIERDQTNVRWIAEVADRVGVLLEGCLEALGGAAKITRDPPPEDEASSIATVTPTARVVAVIPTDIDRSSLGRPRPLAEPLYAGRTLLDLTLSRLARCKRVDHAVILTPTPDRVRTLLDDAEDHPGLTVEVVEHASPFGPRHAATASARLTAPHAWRGGIGGLTVYDELLNANAVDEALERTRADAAVLVGPDWAMVDPALTDAVIERFAESPSKHRLVFTQAAPGLVPCVIARSLAGELASATDAWAASIGGILTYLPPAPRHDPITSGHCVAVPDQLRDVLMRCIPDSAARRRAIAEAMLDIDGNASDATSLELARLLSDQHRRYAGPTPRHLVLELCTGRRAGGRRAMWIAGSDEPAERLPIDPALAARLVREQSRGRADAMLTLGGAGDPLLHPAWREIVMTARASSIACLHVRTDLLVGEDVLESLLHPDTMPDVISVDLLAHDAVTYQSITGVDAYALARGNLESLLERRAAMGGSFGTPWIVPRITRCDAVYEQIEPFFAEWTMRTGACVIDPMPRAQAGERISPLPLPPGVPGATSRDAMLVLADGSVPLAFDDFAGDRLIGRADQDGLGDVWRRIVGSAASLEQLA